MVRHRGDRAVSDIIGSLLMVGTVVLAGGALTAVVADSLATPPIPLTSFALGEVHPGDGKLNLTLRQGDTLPLDLLRVTIQRGNGSASEVARAAWTTMNATQLRASDRLAFPLVPPAVAGEPLTLRVHLTSPSSLLVTLTAIPHGAFPVFAKANVTSMLTPASILADSASAAKVTARVSHPAGAGAIARVEANASALYQGSGTATANMTLNDQGFGGDEVGGDGVWTALLRPPSTTSPGNYSIPISVTTLDGSAGGSSTVWLRVIGNSTSPNLTGPAPPCWGCPRTGGVGAIEGTRLTAPPSANITTLQLRNWNWDKLTPSKLRDDALVIRVVNSSAAWSMYIRFDQVGTQPCITYARAWTGTDQTVYAPKNGTCLSLVNLDLDLNDPVASQQLVVTSGIANPGALYRSAGLKGDTTFLVAYMRDEDPTGSVDMSLEAGIFSVDVVIA